MKKFKVKVIRTDEYDITIDPNIWSEKELKNWSSVFYPTEDLSELAKHLACAMMIEGSGEFLEGFGHIKRVGCENITKKTCPGIEVDIIEENNDYEIEIEAK